MRLYWCLQPKEVTKPVPFDKVLVNSSAPGICGRNFKSTLFKLIIQKNSLSTRSEIALSWMPQNLTNKKSTLVWVMTWVSSDHNPCLCRHMLALGYNELNWMLLHWTCIVYKFSTLWPISTQLIFSEILTKDTPEFTHHYSDVIMSMMTSQITSVVIVCSTVNSDTDQRKNQSSMSMAFWGVSIGDRWNHLTKGQ